MSSNTYLPKLLDNVSFTTLPPSLTNLINAPSTGLLFIVSVTIPSIGSAQIGGSVYK